MDNQVSGTVCVIEPTQTFGNKGFRKRTVVLEQEKGSFTNYVPIEFTKDACDTVDALNEGDEITVNFRLNGRKWQKDASSDVKYFLSAEALSFTVQSRASVGHTPEYEPQDRTTYVSNHEEDVPF